LGVDGFPGRAEERGHVGRRQQEWDTLDAPPGVLVLCQKSRVITFIGPPSKGSGVYFRLLLALVAAQFSTRTDESGAFRTPWMTPRRAPSTLTAAP
jgi:hypothetical protein